MQIALLVENESRTAEYQVETRKFFPKSCDLQDLFGYFDEADSSVWIDGIFTRVLRYIAKTLVVYFPQEMNDEESIRLLYGIIFTENGTQIH